MKRMLSLILALCMITALLVGCGTKDTPANNDTDTSDTKAVTISVGTYSAANSVDGVAMEYFKEYVEEKSAAASRSTCITTTSWVTPMARSKTSLWAPRTSSSPVSIP